jgi:hypothetical protein
MENPPADSPDRDRLLQLHSVVLALEVWKQGLGREFSPAEKEAVGSVMGWWSDQRLPYTPETAVAYGTRARSRIPADAPVAGWPLAERPLAGTFDAPLGAKPAEVILRGGELASVLAAQRGRPGSYWGPLWTESGDASRYLVGLRVGVPGRNEAVVEYSYELPRRGVGPSTND